MHTRRAKYLCKTSAIRTAVDVSAVHSGTDLRRYRKHRRGTRGLEELVSLDLLFTTASVAIGRGVSSLLRVLVYVPDDPQIQRRSKHVFPRS